MNICGTMFLFEKLIKCIIFLFQKSVKYDSIFYDMVLQYRYKRKYKKNISRFLLITEVKMLHYYLDFTQNRGLMLSAPSSFEDDKNTDDGIWIHVQIILPLGYLKSRGKMTVFHDVLRYLAFVANIKYISRPKLSMFFVVE